MLTLTKCGEDTWNVSDDDDDDNWVGMILRHPNDKFGYYMNYAAGYNVYADISRQIADKLDELKKEKG